VHEVQTNVKNDITFYDSIGNGSGGRVEYIYIVGVLVLESLRNLDEFPIIHCHWNDAKRVLLTSNPEVNLTYAVACDDCTDKNF
jgi:hypothetical protein